MSIVAIFAGIISLLIGLVVRWIAQQRSGQYSLIRSTSTTEVRAIDSEGVVELNGKISPTKETETFTSPVARNSDALFAGWEVQEWSESGSNYWKTIASGIRSVPFVLDDGTGEIRVEIDDVDNGVKLLSNDRASITNGTAVDELTCIFQDWPVIEVGVKSEPPQHIRDFVASERAVSEQSGSITNLIDIGNKHGDRRYYEQTLSPNDDVYLLGTVHAEAGATTPLHAEDAVIKPTDGEKFVISDRSENELIDTMGSKYRRTLAICGVFVVFGIALIVATFLSII